MLEDQISKKLDRLLLVIIKNQEIVQIEISRNICSQF